MRNGEADLRKSAIYLEYPTVSRRQLERQHHIDRYRTRRRHLGNIYSVEQARVNQKLGC